MRPLCGAAQVLATSGESAEVRGGFTERLARLYAEVTWCSYELNIIHVSPSLCIYT